MSTSTAWKNVSATTIDRVRETIRQLWGYDSFRPLQQEAIEAVLADRDTVVVLPTGGGKSLCFQAPACCREGLAVVVSPLISLMKDQVDALQTNGVAAAFYNSSLSTAERSTVIEAVRCDALKLLYLAPESLLNEHMLALLGSVPLSMFAIDEAHCISSWGHDFRPEYRGLRLLKQRFPEVAVHAYTATATERVRHDIAAQLALEEPEILVGSFDRPNLNYRVQRRTRGLEQMLEVIERHQNESGIVYCISRKEVERIAESLNTLGHSAVAYHAGLSDEERIGNQESFLEERINIVVATVAFGMGIDKSNVRFVVHWGMPKSLEAYQQESGRAGRDGLEADCCLFFGGNDYGTWTRLMASSGEANDAALEALQAMDRFCSSTSCRHQDLVRYFGQSIEQQQCGACDVCLDQIELVDDSLITAQKILSCVVRLEQMYGADYTSQVLAGSQDQRILEKQHDRLSTHGILSEFPKAAIRDWIEQLIGQECARKVGEYSQLEVTDLGWQVLRGEHTPRLLKPATRGGARGRPSAADPASWEGVDRGLFESLRDLRRELAGEQGVPAYIVFGDAALRDMARRRPSSLDSFLEVQGVGQKKCKDYGELFVKHIAEYCDAGGIATDVSAAPLPPRKPAEVSASAVAAFENFKAGESVAEAAKSLGRAESTVRGYLSQFLRHEQITDPTPWVDEATARRVRDAIEQVGGDRLKALFEYLNGEVSYDDIRIVASCLANATAG
ncbi:MAG: DNA helicase RecQ [Planctomycetales bacterium]|nr:DNA helicase RecQ [Planctomycetales bacterium]